MSRPKPSSLPPGGAQSLLAGRLALVAAALFWSGNFVAGRALREALDPLTLNLLRWCLAAAIFTPFVGRALWHARGEIRAHWRVIIGLCVTGVIGFQVLTYQALTETTVVNAVLMLATMPVVILGLSAALSRKRIPVAGWAAVALSVLGVAVLLTGGDLSALAQARLGRGDLWMLAAVLAWSIYTLLLRQRPAGISGNVLVLAMVLPALPVMGGAVALWGQTDLASLRPQDWALVGYVGIFPSLLAFLCWNYGVSKVGPEAAGFFINLMPVFATTLAWALLGEAITAPQLAGAALIIGAIALSQRAS